MISPIPQPVLTRGKALNQPRPEVGVFSELGSRLLLDLIGATAIVGQKLDDELFFVLHQNDN
jgi:hypothetical protein